MNARVVKSQSLLDRCSGHQLLMEGSEYTRDKPGSADDKPGNGNNMPGNTNEKPSNGENKPGGTSKHTRAVSEKHHVLWEYYRCAGKS